ncbi:hypothetical protein CLCR_03772 [Cladophialophora carrionii]|uniref:Uncharacterized protein n=1 Tax=Cladophialophora carrionii TaxID=86049 RepID=A0A1C1CG47_9EURO|nr:hypothetical protein CLCR_03772 [Cladophialophora carrionii]
MPLLEDWQICLSEAHLPDEQGLVLAFSEKYWRCLGNFQAKFHTRGRQRAKAELRNDDVPAACTTTEQLQQNTEDYPIEDPYGVRIWEIPQ